MSAGQLERIVGDAVRELVAGQGCKARVEHAVTRIPVRLASADDAHSLLVWLRKLCADDAWRERFVRGDLQIDIELGMPQQPVAAAPPVAAAACVEGQGRRLTLNERVVTEAMLRRLAIANDVIALPARAVITPSARDYARAAGIRMERET